MILESLHIFHYINKPATQCSRLIYILPLLVW